jgi:hypothetical protein
MELFLNLLWFALSLAALWIWRSRWVSEAAFSHSDPWRQWTAFSCAAVLMFFVVSLSDDLRAEYPLFDESSTSRRPSANIDAQHGALSSPTHGPASALAILPAFAAPFVPVISALDVPPAPAHASSVLLRLSSGRSPPFRAES